LNLGYEVIAFDNLKRRGVEHNLRFLIKRKGFTWIKGDVTNQDDLSLLNSQHIDGIIHLAANPGVPTSLDLPIYDFNVNAFGTLNMLEFSRKNGNIPLILASTNKIYSSDIDDLPMIEKETRYEWSENTIKAIDENFKVDGKFHSPYGCSKLTADIYAREYFSTYGVPTVVNRMSCIYGSHQFGKEEQGWVSWFCIAKIKGLPVTIFGDGKQVRDCLFGEDLAELYELQLRNIDVFKGQVFNVGGGLKNTMSLLELVHTLDTRFGWYPKLQVTFTDWRQADQKIYISDINKLSQYWEPKTDILSGLRKTFRWVEGYQQYIPIEI
jgi:CDP-paratose 2-epimerase